MNLSKIKYLFPAMILMGLPQLAFAQSAAPLTGLYACQSVSDKEAQLSCFLTETAKLRAAETTGDIVALDKDRFIEIKKEEVKKSDIQNDEIRATEVRVPEVKADKPKKTKTAKERTLAIRSASVNAATGYIRFTLENGEVWRQTQSGRLRLGTGNPDVLVIKKGSFNSFRARVNDKAPSIRVKRVK